MPRHLILLHHRSGRRNRRSLPFHKRDPIPKIWRISDVLIRLALLSPRIETRKRRRGSRTLDPDAIGFLIFTFQSLNIISRPSMRRSGHDRRCSTARLIAEPEDSRYYSDGLHATNRRSYNGLWSSLQLYPPRRQSSAVKVW
ncbi:uncharacterized protein RCC_09538 [Ramularia collo-cygni]|uniref:Uncharacterized protein n=1 Tax=Ramularia collo-cygni TaxID=112498 RepID=A0A2D3VM81_9PEZI|nr:uncharacterized protein RCC_09538 [Ramularia collo-cygni]CZT23824.1 uncharacterized protein RCC_09538 [Ramularia collo-cygni]